MSKDKKKKKKKDKKGTTVSTDMSTPVIPESEQIEASVPEKPKIETKSETNAVSNMVKRRAEKYKVEYDTLQKLRDWVNVEYERLDAAYRKKEGSNEEALALAKTDSKKLKLLKMESADLAEILGAMKELYRLDCKLERRQKRLLGDN